MIIALSLATALLALVLAYTSVRLAVYRYGLKEINQEFSFAIKGDTNARVTVSSGDKTLRAFADNLNGALADLREKELTYLKGDREIKSAIANVSHDLRTPLTAICGYLELIKDETDPDKVKKYLGIVHERTVALRQLTEELFGYTLTCNGERKLNVQTLSLGSVLEETLLGFYDALSERNITPDLHFCNATFECIADKSVLVRIFENVIGNAVKHSDGDFAITLNADGSIDFENTANSLDTVSVGKLFDRFFTVENGKTSTGLGLSIAKNLTQSLGGDISASLDGNRLRIHVVIPCKKIK